MLTQYAAAAVASENKVLSHPASADTIPNSANVGDHVTMGVTSARHALQKMDNVEYILTIELIAAAQGIDFRREQLGSLARFGIGTQPIYHLIRQHVHFVEDDVILYPYLEVVRNLIDAGSIVAAAESNSSAETQC